MANRYKTFSDILLELKAELRIPTGDTSEDLTLLSLFQNATMESFIEAKGRFNDQVVLTGTVTAASSFSVSIAMVAIDALEVTCLGATYDLKPRGSVVGPAHADNAPRAYSIASAAPATASAATVSSTFSFYPSANYTLTYRLIYKGLHIPATTTETVVLAYEDLFPMIYKKVIQRMLTKQGNLEAKV